MANVKKGDIYKNIVKYFETRCDTSNYQADRPLPMEKNEKVIGLMKDESSEQTILDQELKRIAI